MDLQRSADTRVLEGVLAEVEVGQTITYEELSKAIGRDVRKHSRSSLRTARQGLQKDRQIVFDVQRNVGLVRLNDSQIVASTERDRLHLHRAAKRSLSKLSAADFSKLSEEDKRQHLAYSAQAGAIAMFAHKSGLKKIESAVAVKDDHQLAIGDTLKLFGG